MNHDEIILLTKYIELLSTPNGRFNVNRIYHEVFRTLFGRNSIATRRGLQLATTGCRFWQLFYAMLWHFIQQKKEILAWLDRPHRLSHSSSSNEDRNESILSMLETGIHRVYQDSSSVFHKLVYGNKGKICSDSSPPSDVCVHPYQPGLSLSQDGNYYLCIYIDRPDGTIDISHYFTVIHVGTEYYLTSSYGSDYVRVPYRIQPLPIEDLNQLQDSLSHLANPLHKEKIVEFYMTYFLQGNLPPFYSEENVEGNPALKGKRVLNGQSREIKEVFNGKEEGTIHVGILSGYESEIEKIMNSSWRNRGGKRRTRIKKRKLRKTIKRRYRF